MNAYWKRPLTFPWPPFIYALGIVAAIILGTLRPLDIHGIDWTTAKIIGSILVATAAALDIWALLTLRRAQTTVMPHRGSVRLVTNGPFFFSRNPIYLGYTLMTAGLGFLFDNGWFLGAAIICAIITHLIAIKAEERHLLARFGIDFEQYCRRTRAWV